MVKNIIQFIQSRILFKFLTSSLLILSTAIILIEVVVYQESSQQIKKLTEDRQMHLTSMHADLINQNILKLQIELKIAASIPAIKSYLLNMQSTPNLDTQKYIKEIFLFFSQMYLRDNSYIDIRICNKNNHIALHMIDGSLQLDKQNIDGDCGNKHKKIQNILTFSVPVISENIKIGFLEIDYSIDNMISNIKDVKIFESGYLALYDENRKVLYDPVLKIGTEASNIRIQKGKHKNEFQQYVGDDQRKKIVFYEFIQETQWIISATVYEDEMFAPLSASVRYVIVFILLALAIEILLISSLTRRLMTVPLQSLLIGVNKVLQGNYYHQLDITSSDEIGQLGRTFNEMTLTLNHTISELKKQKKDLQFEIDEKNRIGNELQESNALNKSFFKYTNSLIFIKDTKLRYIKVNDQFSKIMGREEKDIIGMTVFDIFDKETATKSTANDDHVIANQKAILFEEVNYVGNQAFYYLTTRFPLYHQSGGLLGVCGIATDITKRKFTEQSLRESEQYNRMLFETSTIGLVLSRSNGEIVDVNQAFASIIGRSVSETLKLSKWEITPEKYRDQEAHHASVLGLNQRYGPYEKEIFHKKGHLVPVRLSGALVHRGEETFTWSYCEDITDLKNTQKDLENLNRQLEQRVSERTNELNLSLKSLRKTQEQLVESKKMASLGGLVAGVAHEINTPLGVAITGISYLVDTQNDLISATDGGHISKASFIKSMKSLQVLASSAFSNLQHAAELVNSFKQVAVDQASDGRRYFSVKDYLSNVISSLSPVIGKGKYKIELLGDTPVQINSYPGVFSQIISNLVMNSMLHGFENSDSGTMSLKLSQTDVKLELIYSDNGIGMDAQQINSIFEPFYTTKRGHGGTGLGMFIVYNLVTQKLKGNIQCASIPGDGTTFTINIPQNI